MPTIVTWDAAFVACACRQFADQLAAGSPYESPDAAIAAARHIWWNSVGVEGWLEAFAAHPKLGDKGAVAAKFGSGSFGEHSQSEQAAALATGDDLVFEELAALNAQYERKFGHIFILCASGRTAPEVLAALRRRIGQPPYAELGAAAREQIKITEMRLAKALAVQPPPPPLPPPPPAASRAAARTEQLATHIAGGPAPAPHAGAVRSPITTHVLDAALGRPAEGLPLCLARRMDDSAGGADPTSGAGVWDPLAASVTDADGRVSDLLPPAGHVAPGTYRVTFDTGAYLRRCRERHPSVFAAVPFYPTASVEFTVTPDMTHQHFHIPLLLSPYSYSTYRGS